MLHKIETKKMLNRVIERLQNNMGLSIKYRYLYRKDGRPIENIYQLLDGEYTYLISSMPRFAGLNISYEKNKDSLEKYIDVISKLEYPLISVSDGNQDIKNYVTIEDHVENKHKKIKDDVINFAYMNTGVMTAEELESIYKKVKRNQYT